MNRRNLLPSRVSCPTCDDDAPIFNPLRLTKLLVTFMYDARLLALVPSPGSADATVRLIPRAQVPAGVLVDLGRGEPKSGARLGAAIPRRRWAAPEMVEKFQVELKGVLAFIGFPGQWRSLTGHELIKKVNSEQSLSLPAEMP